MINSQKRRFKVRAQRDFFQKLNRLSISGIQHKEIVNQLKKYGSPIEKEVANDIAKAIVKGGSFSEGIEPWVSSTTFLHISSAERVGNIQKGFKNAIKSIEVHEISSLSLIKALLKPFFGLVFLFFISALISYFIFPMLEEQMPLQRWGDLSLFAYNFGLLFLNYGLVLLGFLLILSAMIVVALPYWPERNLMDNFFIFRQYRLIQVVNFLTTLSNQAHAGISLKKSIVDYKASSSPYMQNHLSSILLNIKRGRSNIGDIFQVGLLNKEEEDVLYLLSKADDTVSTLEKSAHMHQELLITEMSKMKFLGVNGLKLIAGGVCFIMGGGVLFLILNIATTIRI